MQIASVTYGHSCYHDTVWAWLNKHYKWFGDYGYEMADAYDFWRSWGLLALAGCSVECYGNDAPPPYACDWGEGVNITFDGDVTELVRRLDSLRPNAEVGQ